MGVTIIIIADTSIMISGRYSSTSATIAPAATGWLTYARRTTPPTASQRCISTIMLPRRLSFENSSHFITSATLAKKFH
jgi:hypothetical protein